MAEQVEQLTAPSSDSATVVLALVETVALDPGADAAKLERIIAIYERLKAKEAERVQRGEGPDPEKACRHYDCEEQDRPL
jgi:hypothetical protein